VIAVDVAGFPAPLAWPWAHERSWGCSVRFDEISFTPGRLADIRSGA
jgi:hypothetical protein